MLTKNREIADQLRARAADLIEQAEALDEGHVEVVYPVDEAVPEERGAYLRADEYEVPQDPALGTICDGCE